VEIVDENSEPLLEVRRGRPSMYDWDNWLRHNKVVRLTHGKDFTCKPESLRPQIYNQAAARNGSAKVHFGHDLSHRRTIDITFTFNESAFTDLMEREDELERQRAILRERRVPPPTPSAPLGFDAEETEEERELRRGRARAANVEIANELGIRDLDNRPAGKWGPPEE
jgi:hypothetical protein